MTVYWCEDLSDILRVVQVIFRNNITVSVLHIKELECKVEKLKHMNEDKKQT